MCSLCDEFGELTDFAWCDICHERAKIKIKSHYENGVLNREQYECLSVTRNFNEHKQAHSEMLDVCIDSEMLLLVEYVNAIGVTTNYSCVEQRPGLPGIVIKRTVPEEIQEIIKEAAPDLHELIEYYAWSGFDINGTFTRDLTLYFPDGVPAQFRA